MKIAVLGANGKTGQDVVRLALSQGYQVTAGLRGASRLAEHPHLRVVQCEATNEEQLEKLVENQDVVISVLGHSKNSSVSVQTEATKKLVIVMNRLGVKRVVAVTGTGVRFPGDQITVMDAIMNLAVGMVDPARVADGKQFVEVLQASTLDWTVIRVLKLTQNGERPFQLTLNGPAQTFVARQEVAKAILQVIQEKSFIGQAPIISS